MNSPVTECEQGAKSRLSRCRAMIADISKVPRQMEDELTSELNAMLWHRMGAHPVYHLVRARGTWAWGVASPRMRRG
eukprot:1188191-Prorocentrum_minimum.AAC.3